eukprot:g13726.t1
MEVPAVPIIVDTDIGDDVDDTWALLFLLALKKYANIVLVSTAGKGSHRKRAAVVAQLCKGAGRDDIPIVCGTYDDSESGKKLAQEKWLDFSVEKTLSAYPSFLDRTTASQQIVNTVMTSKDNVTILAIGPMHNIADALKLEPRIAKRANFVSMAGSIYKGYGNSNTPAAEFNIASAVEEAKTVFKAKWLTSYNVPLDTCGEIVIDGEAFNRIVDASILCSSSMANMLMDNFNVWYDNTDLFTRFPVLRKYINPARGGRSSTLFDTLAALVAVRSTLSSHINNWITFQNLFVEVDDNGFTKIVDFTSLDGQYHNFATFWKHKNAKDEFIDFLVNALTKTFDRDKSPKQYNVIAKL